MFGATIWFIDSYDILLIYRYLWYTTNKTSPWQPLLSKTWPWIMGVHSFVEKGNLNYKMYKLLLAQFFILNQSPSCCKLSLAVKVNESLYLIPVGSWTWDNLHLSKASVVPGNQAAAPGHCKWWDTQTVRPRRAKHITLIPTIDQWQN